VRFCAAASRVAYLWKGLPASRILGLSELAIREAGDLIEIGDARTRSCELSPYLTPGTRISRASEPRSRRTPQAAPNSCSPGWGRGRRQLNLWAKRSR
jgi:hypothetical protein